MGFSLKKAFKKVAKIVSFGAYHGGSGGGAVEAPPPVPAPELELTNQEGEAEQKKEAVKIKYRKGKKALKISKNDTPVTGAGRNIV